MYFIGLQFEFSNISLYSPYFKCKISHWWFKIAIKNMFLGMFVEYVIGNNFTVLNYFITVLEVSYTGFFLFSILYLILVEMPPKLGLI